MISLQKEDPAKQGLAGVKKADRRGNKTVYFEKIKGQPAEELHHEEHRCDETRTGDGSVPAASLAVVGDDNEGSSVDDCGCEVLSELDCWGSKETIKDLKFGYELFTEQRRELEDLAGYYFLIITDRHGSTTVEEHRIQLNVFNTY
ncbi:hypothetical protein PoB_004710900 [Plakobranchus ocellatus]|uniref:Uncharacterized protein n=1 Tax=Plakobranchus ocellatus TaxID=259542 RepID=A0AAV4BP29_9GAST|nr:hypothetical protein PoB_004710900 [Plakobranchus ocellatus]